MIALTIADVIILLILQLHPGIIFWNHWTPVKFQL